MDKGRYCLQVISFNCSKILIGVGNLEDLLNSCFISLSSLELGIAFVLHKCGMPWHITFVTS